MHQEHQWIKLDNSERVMNKRTEKNHQDFPANTSRGWTWVLEQGTPLMAWVNTCTIRVSVYFRSTLLKERESKVHSSIRRLKLLVESWPLCWSFWNKPVSVPLLCEVFFLMVCGRIKAANSNQSALHNRTERQHGCGVQSCSFPPPSAEDIRPLFSRKPLENFKTTPCI